MARPEAAHGAGNNALTASIPPYKTEDVLAVKAVLSWHPIGLRQKRRSPSTEGADTMVGFVSARRQVTEPAFEAELPTLNYSGSPGKATVSKAFGNTEPHHFRCLESSLYEEALGASTVSLSLKQDAPPSQPNRLHSQGKPQALSRAKQKLAHWRKPMGPTNSVAQGRPDSFMCATAAAVEEAYRSGRDRYEAAVPTLQALPAKPHYAVQPAMPILDAYDKSPMSAALAERARSLSSRVSQQQKNSGLPLKYSSGRGHQPTFGRTSPVPPMPEHCKEMIERHKAAGACSTQA